MHKILAWGLTLCLASFSTSSYASGQLSADFDLWSFEGGSLLTVKNEPVPPGMSIVRLVTLTSDKDSNRNYLHAMVDKNRNVTGIYNLGDEKNRDGSEGNGKSIIWLDDIERPKGAVMYTAKGRNVLIMKGKLNKSTQEGRFQIDYLANGLFGRYETCEFNLRRNGSGWYVENAYTGKLVSDVKIITHSLGVETLQGLCAE